MIKKYFRQSFVKSVKKRRHYHNVERRTGTITVNPIAGHRYSELAVRLCILLYVYSGCSFRCIPKILEIINLVLLDLPDTIPCHTTVKNWVEKAGFDIYKNRGKKLNELYALILDESVTVGDQKILLQLQVPAAPSGRSLTHPDVEVVGMDVSDSWASDKVREKIKETSEHIEGSPEYVISDNGSNLCKAVREAGIAHHKDISHSLGVFLQRVYHEDVDFKEFTKEMGQTRKYSMTNAAYLMPPNQRSLARFMNLFDWVRWGQQMIANFHTFSDKEKSMYSFIPANASFIEELYEIMTAYEQIQQLCKKKGLSKQTANTCRKIVYKKLMGGNGRMQKLGNYILEYFLKEEKLLKSSNEVHNISSDIIESTFGIYKDRKSPNKLYGVTSFVLTIPLYTKVSTLELAETFEVKERMERVKVKEVKEWAKGNLGNNWVVKRTKRLSTFL